MWADKPISGASLSSPSTVICADEIVSHPASQPATALVSSLCAQIIPPPGYSSLLLADTLAPSLPEKHPSKLFAHFSSFLLKSFGIKSQLCEAPAPGDFGVMNVVLVTRRAGRGGSMDRQSLNEIPLVNAIMIKLLLLLLLTLMRMLACAAVDVGRVDL